MTRVRLFVGLVVVCLGVGLFFVVRMARSKPDGERAAAIPLHIPSEKLKFGPVWEDEAFVWVLPIRNTGTEPIEVESIGASCTCASVSPRSFVVPPQGEVELTLTINLMVKQQEDGRIGIALTPKIKSGPNAKPPHIRWEIEGTVKRCLRFERTTVLAKRSELATPLQPWTVPIESAEPLDSLGAACDLPELKPSTAPIDTSRKKWVLMLTPPETLPIRTLEGVVILDPVLQSGTKVPSRRMKIHAEIVADAVAEPPEVLTGGRKQGEVIEDMIAIRSLTNREWKVEEVSAEGQGLTVERLDDARVRIKQLVCQNGSRQNFIRLTLTADGKKSTLSVAVNYTGLSAEE